MKKGFGETVPSGIEASLIRQLVRPCQLVLNEQQEDAEFMFYTTKKRLSSLRKVVHSLAQQYPQLFFRVVLFEGSSVARIAKKRICKEGYSYTWVEKSSYSGKWLVMAIPPGAREHRSLVVFNDKTKAEEVANSIEPLIVRMPLSDWHKRGKAYQALLSSLPEDEDGIIGTMSADTGRSFFCR